MPFARKVVLHSLSGYQPSLDELVRQFMRDGVSYVGVVGMDALHIEDIVDELCVGDGTQPYEMLTASHEGQSLESAVQFAAALTGKFAGETQVVEF